MNICNESLLIFTVVILDNFYDNISFDMKNFDKILGLRFEKTGQEFYFRFSNRYSCKTEVIVSIFTWMH